MHPYFFMAIILLGLSVTLACTLTATLAGYVVVSFQRRRARGAVMRLVSRLQVGPVILARAGRPGMNALQWSGGRADHSAAPGLPSRQ